jgi:hypothetical protein
MTGAGAVLAEILRRPWEPLVRNWNWKSALLSSLLRASVFFGVNLGAGWRKALAAMLTELVFRAITAGWYGSITQSFRRVRPAWQAALVLVPTLLVFQHGLELLVHWARGTPRLAASIGASIVFTVLSTNVNLALMRRGAMVVGAEGKSLAQDLTSLSGLAGEALGRLRAFVTNI